MSPTQALFWKEWRQMQWRWTFSVVVCCLFMIVGLKTRVLQDEVIVLMSMCGCAFLLPLFIGMGLFAEEREEGSIRMQLAIPVHTGRIYIVKMILGAAAVATLAIAALLLTIIMAGDREKSTADIIRIYGFVVPFEVVFLLWIIVFSMKRKTQWAAALTGISIVALWVFFILIEEIFLPAGWKLSLIITPLGFLEAGPDNGSWLATSIVQSILAVILFWWGMKRFSTLTRSSK